RRHTRFSRDWSSDVCSSDLGGVVSHSRDTKLADRLLRQVRACCLSACEVLICTDGWAAYPGSIKRAFREKVKGTVGRGRAHLEKIGRASCRERGERGEGGGG